MLKVLRNACTAFRWTQPQDGFKSSLTATKLTLVLRTTGTISTGFAKVLVGEGAENLLLITVIPRNRTALTTYLQLISTKHTRISQVRT